MCFNLVSWWPVLFLAREEREWLYKVAGGLILAIKPDQLPVWSHCHVVSIPAHVHPAHRTMPPPPVENISRTFNQFLPTFWLGPVTRSPPTLSNTDGILGGGLRDLSQIGSWPLMKHYIDWYFLNLFCQNSNWLLCRWWELSQQLHKRDSRSEEAEEGQNCLHWLPAPDPGEKLREAEVSVSPGQTGAGSQAEPVRHSGQDLVPEQEDQVEEDHQRGTGAPPGRAELHGPAASSLQKSLPWSLPSSSSRWSCRHPPRPRDVSPPECRHRSLFFNGSLQASTLPSPWQSASGRHPSPRQPPHDFFQLPPVGCHQPG